MGRRTGCPWSLQCPLLWTPGPALSGERTHVCESGLSGSMGEAGKTGHVCVRPCGPHLRVSETSRRCNPADAGAVPFPARGQLPRMCRRAEGARRRAGPPCRAATPTDTARHRPPRPRTCSPNLRRQQALDSGLMAPGTLPLSPLASGALPLARRPNRSFRGSRQRSPGRDRLTAAAEWLPTGGAHVPGPTPTAAPP